MVSQAFDLTPAQIKKSRHAHVTTREELASWLCQELETALANRGPIDAEIRYAWQLYEQDRTRSNPPWPNAADLTSPMAREAVDAIQARLMQTIFVDPVWMVAGWGNDAKRAPFVEEFHQRAQEEERFQGYMDEATQRALIEGVGILRVREGVDYRREMRRLRAQWATDPETGAPLMDEDHQPQVVRDALGNAVPASDDPNLPSVDGEFDQLEPVRVGPAYEVVPFLDQVLLPAHARNRTQVWGEGFRFWRRVPELQSWAQMGVYDADAVEALGESDERSTADDAPRTAIVTDQRGPTAQKELWEVSFLADLDGKGERWWLATVSREHTQILRLKKNDRTTRAFRFIPFPKAGQVDRGYSLVTGVGRTVIEEDTAVRNMRADKATMAIAAPVKKLQGALWDEYEQPFGARAVITVRDMREVEQMQVSDVPASINIWASSIRQDADRLFGQNDTALGVDSGEDNTLGEERLRASYVEIRMDLLIKRMKEPLEELWQVRHAIWKRTLAGMQESVSPAVQRTLAGLSEQAIQSVTGQPAPPQQGGEPVVFGQTPQGVPFSSTVKDGTIVAQMLEGAFWGAPRGSVETADIGKQRQDFVAFLSTLPKMAQFMPMMQVMLGLPPVMQSILEQAMHVFKWQDKQAFLGAETQQAMQAAVAAQRQQQQIAQVMAMMGGAGGPGGPPGGPPPEAPAGAPPS